MTTDLQPVSAAAVLLAVPHSLVLIAFQPQCNTAAPITTQPCGRNILSNLVMSVRILGSLRATCQSTVGFDGCFPITSNLHRKSAIDEYTLNVKPSSHINNYNLHNISVATLSKPYPGTRTLMREGIQTHDCGFVVRTWGGGSLSLAPFLALLLVLLTICELSWKHIRCTGETRPKTCKLSRFAKH